MTEKTEPCRNQPKYYKLLQIRYHKHKVSLFKRATPGVFLKKLCSFIQAFITQRGPSLFLG